MFKQLFIGHIGYLQKLLIKAYAFASGKINIL